MFHWGSGKTGRGVTWRMVMRGGRMNRGGRVEFVFSEAARRAFSHGCATTLCV